MPVNVDYLGLSRTRSFDQTALNESDNCRLGENCT